MSSFNFLLVKLRMLNQVSLKTVMLSSPPIYDNSVVITLSSLCFRRVLSLRQVLHLCNVMIVSLLLRLLLSRRPDYDSVLYFKSSSLFFSSKSCLLNQVYTYDGVLLLFQTTVCLLLILFAPDFI